MSVFDVLWRSIFEQAQPPRKRNRQTLDLGNSLLTSFGTGPVATPFIEDSDELASYYRLVQLEKKYSCVKMVFQASLNEKFSQSTFEVETETNPIRNVYFMRPEEYEDVYIYREDEERNFYMYRDDELAADSSIIIKVPAPLYSSNLDGVKAAAQLISVAGKSIKYISL